MKLTGIDDPEPNGEEDAAEAQAEENVVEVKDAEDGPPTLED